MVTTVLVAGGDCPRVVGALVNKRESPSTGVVEGLGVFPNRGDKI